MRSLAGRTTCAAGTRGSRRRRHRCERLLLRYVLANTADGRGCVGFAAVRQRDRLDGFIRRPPGKRLTEADVPRLLGRIGVRGVIG